MEVVGRIKGGGGEKERERKGGLKEEEEEEGKTMGMGMVRRDSSVRGVLVAHIRGPEFRYQHPCK